METISLRESINIVLQAKNIIKHLEGVALSAAKKAFGNESNIAFVRLDIYPISPNYICLSVYEKFRGETDLLYDFGLEPEDFQSVEHLSVTLIRKLEENRERGRKLQAEQELQNSNDDIKERYGI